ncbi:MAG: hypothetical protein WAN82_03510 [Candidatus Bathyarchaeia archaeon]
MKWEETALEVLKSKFSLPSVTASDSDIERFIDSETKFISQAQDVSALSRIFGVIAYINSLEQPRRAGLLERLLKYLHELKKKLDSIGKTWGVDSYSIGVEFTGLSLTLNFKIPETSS